MELHLTDMAAALIKENVVFTYAESKGSCLKKALYVLTSIKRAELLKMAANSANGHI